MRSLLIILLSAAAGCTGELDPAGSPDAGAGGGGGDQGDEGDEDIAIALGRVTGTNGIGLNLRAEPSTEAAVIELLPEGTIVELLGDPDGGWYRARRDAAEGYVSADFIVVLEEG